MERIYELERLVGLYQRRLDALAARLAAVEQSNAKVWSVSYPATTGGGTGIYWTKGTFSAATGSFSTITPQVQSLAVYQDVGGTLTVVAASATVRWYFKDASGTDKLIPVAPNGDGTYVAIAASCTAV